MGKLEDDQNKLYPPGSPPPPGQTPAAPTPDAQNAVDPLIDQQNRLFPPPAPSDADIIGSGWQSHNFWNLPPGVSQGDYWQAEGRKIAGELGSGVSNVAKTLGDDLTLGYGTDALANLRGADPQSYRDEVTRAKSELRYGAPGLEAMSFLASPFRALRAGSAAEKLVAPVASKLPVAPETAATIAKRVGDFVEGGTYAGASSYGHGERDPTQLATDTAAGGILTTGLGAVSDYAAPAAKWLRSKVYGTPEGTPQEIAAGPPPGALPRTPEQYQDANQLNLWRSQAAHDMAPSQSDVGSYAKSVYGDDPAQWPEALRDIHKAAGKEGAPSLAARIIGHSATQAGTATAQYLGLGLSPEVAAVLHPAAIMATEKVLPAVTGYGSAPVKGALSNAYPALTGWRPEMTTPDWRY
jgi:hypothetical protein